MNPRRAAPQPPTPAPPVPTALRLDLGAGPLRIEMVEKPQPSRWRRNWPILVGLVLVAVFAGVAIAAAGLPTRSLVPLSPPIPSLAVVVARPARLGQGDAGTIGVEVTNQGSTPLKSLRGTVAFADALAVSLPITGSNVLDFGALEPGEGKRRQLAFQLATAAPLTFNLRLAADGQESVSDPQKIALAPVPYLRTFAQYLLGQIAAATLLTLLLQKAVERFVSGNQQKG